MPDVLKLLFEVKLCDIAPYAQSMKYNDAKGTMSFLQYKNNIC